MVERSSRKGFTLIELMMVVALLGVVAAVAVPQFAATVNRLKYANYVIQVHSVFSKARTESIVTNTTQRVICRFDAQRIERRGQKINSSRTGYDESTIEILDVPLEVCRIKTAEKSKKGKNGTDATAYTFLPDGLGNDFQPLAVDIVQGKKLGGKMYWKLRRDSRGRVTLSGPERSN